MTQNDAIELHWVENGIATVYLCSKFRGVVGDTQPLHIEIPLEDFYRQDMITKSLPLKGKKVYVRDDRTEAICITEKITKSADLTKLELELHKESIQSRVLKSKDPFNDSEGVQKMITSNEEPSDEWLLKPQRPTETLEEDNINLEKELDP